MVPFEPLFRNPHLATIAGNFWHRPLDEERFPVRTTLFDTEPGVRVLAHVQEPTHPRGTVVLLHGLEGSSAAGYLRSMAQAALERGYAAVRLNMRSCGGTEGLCATMYHSGLTSDLWAVVRQLKREGSGPLAVVGFSLGGNVALKFAGERGGEAAELVAGVCACSTPIDLAACVERLGKRENTIYARRFVTRLKARIRARAVHQPGRYAVEKLGAVRTVYEFDDLITAPAFGFADAAEYYRTQSAQNFLPFATLPTLLVQAKDDPMIPFEIFEGRAWRANRNVSVLATEHGGHVGFLARRRPRFWLDGAVLEWVEQVTTSAREEVRSLS